MLVLYRCSWAELDPVMRAYHDTEWGIPVNDSRLLFETLMLESFQAGLSWAIILKRRETLRAAYRNFNPQLVANFTDLDINRLMNDPGVIRSRAKIEATIGGAQAFLTMQAKGEDFNEFAWSFVDDQPIVTTTDTVPTKTELSSRISEELKKRGFTFVGPTITYAWMQAVGMVDDHSSYCFRRTERTST